MVRTCGSKSRHHRKGISAQRLLRAVLEPESQHNVLMAERELTRPVRLTLADGRLNPDAIGWSRRPLVDTSGIGGRHSWGRNKRWEYWNVATPTHVLALTVSSIDYAAVHEVWVLDRATERTWGGLPPFCHRVASNCRLRSTKGRRALARRTCRSTSWLSGARCA